MKTENFLVGFFLNQRIVFIIILTVGFNTPHLEAVLQTEDYEADGWRNETSNDQKVDVIGGNKCVPITCEVAKDRQIVEVDDIYELDVGVELDSENIGTKKQWNYSSIDKTGN